MATFTITLKEMAQAQGCVIGQDEYDPRWYGLDSYPLFDETHRNDLNRKIIDHFWNREIGQETISMFRLAMRRKMNEIMPTYNEHYRFSAVQVDPLQTSDIEQTSTNSQAVHATSSSSGDNETKARTVLSDHPQEALSGTGDYATNSSDNISDTTSSADTTSDSTDNSSGDFKTKGSSGHAASLILAARAAIVNVDMMVLAELEHLFMKVWSNGDEFSDHNNYGGYFFGYF